MNSADLVAKCRFQGRYASETQQECTERKNNERIEAADRLEALEAQLAEAIEVLKGTEQRLEAIIVQIDHLSFSLAKGVAGQGIADIRRLVEKEDGRHGQ